MASLPKKKLIVLTVLPMMVLTLTTACNSVFGIEGSGVPVTTTIDIDETAMVDALVITDSFDVGVRVADGPASVEVTVDDNLVEHLDIRVDDGRLLVGFGHGSYDPDVSPVATVSVPSLITLDVSGASKVTVADIDLDDHLIIEASGASKAVVNGDLADLTIDASGASTVEASGTSGALVLDASGASSIGLIDLSAAETTVDLSGASTAAVGSVLRIDGELTGASRLSAPAGVNTSVSTSGASSIDWR